MLINKEAHCNKKNCYTCNPKSSNATFLIDLSQSIIKIHFLIDKYKNKRQYYILQQLPYIQYWN
jgi:hypothetical protein